MKSARIGYSFATAAEAVLDCIEHPGTTWTVLSHSKSGSQEFIEKGAAPIIEAMSAVAETTQELFADELGATDIQVTRLHFANGSRILALPSNPRTARGYPGNVILDEYAHHEDSYSIWAAVSRQIALGHKMRILSTPNGEQGKFFDLAREFGVADGVAPAVNPQKAGAWSWHWVDINMAIAEGCPINQAEMLDLYKGDADTYAQEFQCAFLKAIGSWLSLELIARAEDEGATLDWPAGYLPVGKLSLGIDVGRDGDRTIAWLDEEIGDVAWTRMVMKLHGVPFFTPDGEFASNDQAHLLMPWVKLADRTAMDSTGIGLGLFEFLASKVPGRVIGLNFSGSVPKGENVPENYQSSTGSVKIKTDLAVRMKQRFEQGRNRIPHDLQIRQELMAVKKEYSGGAVKFDAPRIEVDTATAGGKKKKVYAHADSFWAKAMADFAAAGSPAAAFAAVSEKELAASAPVQREARGILSRSFMQLLTREGDNEEMFVPPPDTSERRGRLWR